MLFEYFWEYCLPVKTITLSPKVQIIMPREHRVWSFTFLDFWCRIWKQEELKMWHRKVYTTQNWWFLLKAKPPKFCDSAFLREVPVGLKKREIPYNEEQLNVPPWETALMGFFASAIYACIHPLTISEGSKTKTRGKKPQKSCLVSTQNHKLLPAPLKPSARSAQKTSLQISTTSVQAWMVLMTLKTPEVPSGPRCGCAGAAAAGQDEGGSPRHTAAQREDQILRHSHRVQKPRQGFPSGVGIMAAWSWAVLIRPETQTVSEIVQTHNYKVIYLKIDISRGDGGQRIIPRADHFFLICFGSFCIPSEHVIPPHFTRSYKNSLE